MSDHDDEFTEFVGMVQHRLIRYADLISGDRGRAEDLVQGALVKVYLRWARLRDGNPEAYARTIITHAQTDWWRRRPWREVPSSITPRWSEGSQPDIAPDVAASLTDRDAVMRALASLAPRERAVIVLRYYVDLAEADVARELGCPVGTVKSTTARALAKLRRDRSLMDGVTGT